MSAGAKIVGKSSMGDWCTVGVNTVLHNRNLPDHTLAFNDSNGDLVVKSHDNHHIISRYFTI